MRNPRSAKRWRTTGMCWWAATAETAGTAATDTATAARVPAATATTTTTTVRPDAHRGQSETDQAGADQTARQNPFLHVGLDCPKFKGSLLLKAEFQNYVQVDRLPSDLQMSLASAQIASGLARSRFICPVLLKPVQVAREAAAPVLLQASEPFGRR